MHTHYPPHSKVFVVMKTGERFIARYWKNEGRGVIHFFDHEPVRIRRVKSMGFYKRLNLGARHEEGESA